MISRFFINLRKDTEDVTVGDPTLSSVRFRSIVGNMGAPLDHEGVYDNDDMMEEADEHDTPIASQ